MRHFNDHIIMSYHIHCHCHKWMYVCRFLLFVTLKIWVYKYEFAYDIKVEIELASKVLFVGHLTSFKNFRWYFCVLFFCCYIHKRENKIKVVYCLSLVQKYTSINERKEAEQYWDHVSGGIFSWYHILSGKIITFSLPVM